MPNLQKLSREQQISVLTTPFFVPATENPEMETSFQSDKICETFSGLLRNTKYKLSLPDASQKIQTIGQKYEFELLRLANITRLIREYYFGEVRLENFPAEIEKRVGVSLLTAQEITRYIKSEIIDWDPWAQYIAKLPKIPVREIIERYPKIAEMEITASYIKLRNSDDLEDPTIKNWIKDYVSHLGYEKHSQMDRMQYIFHSENGKNLSSLDREKLSIILKSFDENIPLAVDEENEEIVFDGIEDKVGDAHVRPAPAVNTQAAYTRPLREEQKTAPQTTNNFIKPYAPISRPTLPPQPQSRPTSPQPSPLHIGGQAYKGEGDRPIPQFQPAANIPDNFASQAGKEEINKYFSAHESPDIPSIKIKSITEHNEPRIAPQQNVQRPVQTSPQPSPLQMGGQAYKKEGVARPKHKIIEPFFSKPMPEPRIDGNIVDLSDK